MNAKELAYLPLTNEELGVLVRLMTVNGDAGAYAGACGSELSVIASVASRCAETIANYRQQKENRRAAAGARWQNQKPLRADAPAYAAPIYISSSTDTTNLSNTDTTKRLTPQQQNVADVFAAFRSFDAEPPSGGIVGSWIAKHGIADVLEIVNRLGPAGHLSKGSAYVFGALNKQKKERENAGSGEQRRTARDYGMRSIDDLIAEGKLPALQDDADGGPHDVM